MENNKQVVVSGIRPTGNLHLGSYFGAIRNYVRMQQEYACYFFVADVHSFTTHSDQSHLRDNVFHVLAEYLACGLDPGQATLYVQSDLPETLELYALLNMIAYRGELEKTASFKEKIRLHKENITAGLLTYPVLMSADILIHRAVKVPVGKDQEQHIEMARNFAARFNNKYGYLFPEPEAFNFGANLVKVQALDGSGKMSKSENEMATVYLSDSDETIRKKVMKAKTDAGPSQPDSEKPEYIRNLFQLMELMSPADTVQHFDEAYRNCTIRYGELKKQLAEDMVRFISPIRERADELQADTAYLQKVMKEGAEKARAGAAYTVKAARELMGMKYY